MSRINGEKARAAIERKRRSAQREKDRAKRAALGTAATQAPAAKPTPKVRKKPATS